MKRKSVKNTSTALWIMIVVMIVLIVAIVIINILLQSAEDIKDLMLDLMNSLLSAITVGLIATTFTKIVTDNFAKIKRNNQKLSEFGVEQIGSGISTSKDITELFGNRMRNEYPQEIKMMFISGNGFLKRFKKELIESVKKGNCIVKILIVDVSKSNEEYLKRMDQLCPQGDSSYRSQVEKETLPVLQSLINSLDESQKDMIKVRFYKDEYRYNFRISKYHLDQEYAFGRCWLNIQPFNKDAVDVSVALKGSWEPNNPQKNNIFDLLDNGFDSLWERYEDTEHKFK